MTNYRVMPWPLVIAGCIGMFAATSTGSDTCRSAAISGRNGARVLPAIANLFGLTAAVWGLSSYFAGQFSDRYGRRIFLLVSPACLALAMLAVAVVPGYPWLVLTTIFAGCCCGAFTATLLSEVSLRSPDEFQGRALGYAMTGQSLTLLLGIPVAAWLGASIGWRGLHVVLAVLSVVALLSMLLALRVSAPTSSTSEQAHRSRAPLRDVITGPIARLFAALVVERVAFGLATFYYAAYLRTTYSLPIDAVALPLVGFALGNIAGTIAGGQIADRFAYRRISFAICLAMAGVVALPWFVWQTSVGVTVVLGIAFAFFNALCRPSLLAALADVPPDVRGVVMGLNGSIASVGWLIAALVGGWLYAGIGFGGFGPLMCIMCLTGALIVVPDSRLRRRVAE